MLLSFYIIKEGTLRVSLPLPIAEDRQRNKRNDGMSRATRSAECECIYFIYLTTQPELESLGKAHLLDGNVCSTSCIPCATTGQGETFALTSGNAAAPLMVY